MNVCKHVEFKGIPLVSGCFYKVKRIDGRVFGGKILSIANFLPNEQAILLIFRILKNGRNASEYCASSSISEIEAYFPEQEPGDFI